jgi:hypothetical protein
MVEAVAARSSPKTRIPTVSTREPNAETRFSIEAASPFTASTQFFSITFKYAVFFTLGRGAVFGFSGILLAESGTSQGTTIGINIVEILLNSAIKTYANRVSWSIIPN